MCRPGRRRRTPRMLWRSPPFWEGEVLKGRVHWGAAHGGQAASGPEHKGGDKSDSRCSVRSDWARP